MNLKGLNLWLKHNNFDCTCEKGDNDFEYDNDDEVIFCGNLADNCEDKFTAFARSKGLYRSADIRTIAFLHELGHYNTMDGLTKKQELISLLGKKLINGTPTPNEFIANIKYFIYYRLPVERVATEWAIDYANNNPADLATLDSFMRED